MTRELNCTELMQTVLNFEREDLVSLQAPPALADTSPRVSKLSVVDFGRKKKQQIALDIYSRLAVRFFFILGQYLTQL